MKAPAVLALAVLVALALSPVVSAQPLEQRRSEAQAEVQRLQERLQDAVERYNYACYRLAATRSELASTRAELEQAEAELAENKDRLNRRVRVMYVTRHTQFIDVVVNAGNIDQFLVGLDLTKKVGQKDAELVRRVKEARARLDAASSALEEREAEQAAGSRQMADSKAAVESQLASARGTLSGVEDEVRRAMEQRAAQASASTGTRSYQAPSNPVARRTSPPGAPHGGVVGVAYAQLGKPYVWAGSGPNVFDCSGLVKYCYRHGAGMNLPHSSYAQARSGTPVSVSELQPGDIVGFRGWGHVGIYVGGGQYIHAPHSGAVVRVDSLSARRNYSGAVRP